MVRVLHLATYRTDAVFEGAPTGKGSLNADMYPDRSSFVGGGVEAGCRSKDIRALVDELYREM